MSNYNKVLLMGRLTRDLELRYTQQGTAVGEIGLAVNREFTVNNERRKETTFVDVTIWGRQAEVVNKFLKKGAPIFIEGRLALDTWEGQDGQKKSKLKVVCDHFQFVGGPKGGGESEGYGPGRDESADAGADPYSGGSPGPGGGRRGDWADSPPRQGSPRFSRDPVGSGPGRGSPQGPPASPAPPPRQPADDDSPLGLDDGETPF